MADEQVAMPPRHGYGLLGAGHTCSFAGGNPHLTIVEVSAVTIENWMAMIAAQGLPIAA